VYHKSIKKTSIFEKFFQKPCKIGKMWYNYKAIQIIKKGLKKMKSKLENTKNANEVKLEITVDAEQFDEAIKRVYFKSAKYFNIPGFRKGKAPMQIVEKYYGKEIFYEDAFNDVAQEALEEAVKEHELEIVSRPDIDVTQIEKGKDL